MEFIRSTPQSPAWAGRPSQPGLPAPALPRPDNDVQVNSGLGLTLLSHGLASTDDTLLDASLGTHSTLSANLLRPTATTQTMARAATVATSSTLSAAGALAPATGPLASALPLLSSTSALPMSSCSSFCAGPCGACQDGLTTEDSPPPTPQAAPPQGTTETRSLGDPATSPLAQLDDGVAPTSTASIRDLRMALLPSVLAASSSRSAGVNAAAAPTIRGDLLGATRPPLKMEPPPPVAPLTDPQAVRRSLNKVELNPSMLGVSGNILVRTSVPGMKIDIPSAATLARFVARQFAPGQLSDKTVSEICIVPDLADVPAPAPTPSGEAVRVRGKGRGGGQ